MRIESSRLCAFVENEQVSIGLLSWPDNPVFEAKVEVAGICRSDLKEVQGSRAVRTDFGHEAVMTVLRAPFGSGLNPGDRVVYDPHVEIKRTTAFATHLLADAQPEVIRAAFPKLPPDIPDDVGVFAEPLACAHHAMRRLDEVMGFSSTRSCPIAFTSAGLSPLLQASILRSWGHSPFLCNRSSQRLKTLRDKGVVPLETSSLLSDAPSSHFEAVVVSGAFCEEIGLTHAFRMVADGGVVLLFGGTHEQQIFRGLDIDTIRRAEQEIPVDIDGKSVRLAGTHGATSSDFLGVFSLLCSDVSVGFHHLPRLIESRHRLVDLPIVINDLLESDKAAWGKQLIYPENSVT